MAKQQNYYDIELFHFSMNKLKHAGYYIRPLCFAHLCAASSNLQRLAKGNISFWSHV